MHQRQSDDPEVQEHSIVRLVRPALQGAATEKNNHGEAAPSPQEDLK